MYLFWSSLNKTQRMSISKRVNALGLFLLSISSVFSGLLREIELPIQSWSSPQRFTATSNMDVNNSSIRITSTGFVVLQECSSFNLFWESLVASFISLERRPLRLESKFFTIEYHKVGFRADLCDPFTRRAVAVVDCSRDVCMFRDVDKDLYLRLVPQSNGKDLRISVMRRLGFDVFFSLVFPGKLMVLFPFNINCFRRVPMACCRYFL